MSKDVTPWTTEAIQGWLSMTGQDTRYRFPVM